MTTTEQVAYWKDQCERARGACRVLAAMLPASKLQAVFDAALWSGETLRAVKSKRPSPTLPKRTTRGRR